MKLIELYKEWMKTGRLPSMGLCNSLQRPYKKYLNEFKDHEAGTYWGYPLNYDQQVRIGLCKIYERAHEFTPLRQTIVLLICAMCDEL